MLPCPTWGLVAIEPINSNVMKSICYYSFGCLTWCWQLNGRSYCPFFEWQYVRLSVVFVHLGNEFMFAYPKCFLIRCSRNRRNLVLQRRNGNWEMKKCSLNRSVFLSGVRVSGVDCIQCRNTLKGNQDHRKATKEVLNDWVD